ncbi:transcriptional repressor [bacterium]|nr:transcriptional repressor [bacterium]
MIKQIEEIHEGWKNQGKRLTKQKKIILEIIKQTRSHPTADWVYEQSRKELPNISLGTVYRVLSQLTIEGLINELTFEKQRHFDGFVEDLHSHVICNDCGKIVDISLSYNQILQEFVETQTNYLIDDQNHEFFGICPDCQNKNN